MSAKEFLEKNGIPKGDTEKALMKFAQEYARYKVADFIDAISRNPITCYSQKVSGQEKKFYLGRDYVERCLEAIKHLD